MKYTPFAYLAVLFYGLFIFFPNNIGNKQLIAGDILMAIVIIRLLMTKKTCPLLIISLLWLVCNYVFGLSHTDSIWTAYDGFASATILCNLK